MLITLTCKDIFDYHLYCYSNNNISLVQNSYLGGKKWIETKNWAETKVDENQRRQKQNKSRNQSWTETKGWRKPALNGT